MRPWTVPFFALALLFSAPALAEPAPADAHAAEADHGKAAPAPAANDHGSEAAHGGHAVEAKTPKKPAGPEQVGLTAALVLLLVGSGLGLIPVIKEQLS